MEKYFKVNVVQFGITREIYIRRSNSQYVTTVWVDRNQSCVRKELDSEHYRKGSSEISESDFNLILNQAVNDSTIQGTS